MNDIGKLHIFYTDETMPVSAMCPTNTEESRVQRLSGTIFILPEKIITNTPHHREIIQRGQVVGEIRRV